MSSLNSPCMATWPQISGVGPAVVLAAAERSGGEELGAWLKTHGATTAPADTQGTG